MTEAEWLKCEDPREMHTFITRRTSDRQARLFACACCRSIWDIISDDRSRKAVEVAEAFIDGSVDPEQLEDAANDAQAATDEVYERVFRSAEAVSMELNLGPDSVHGAWECAMNACSALHAACDTCLPDSNDVLAASRSAVLAKCQDVSPLMFTEDCRPNFTMREATEREVGALHCQFLRDIFGNPFRPVEFDAAWRTDTALSLARHMYESRDFSAMPILADALQDAGCDHDDILNHCRDANGVHVRGCWVVDLVLGKV